MIDYKGFKSLKEHQVIEIAEDVKLESKHFRSGEPVLLHLANSSSFLAGRMLDGQCFDGLVQYFEKNRNGKISLTSILSFRNGRLHGPMWMRILSTPENFPVGYLYVDQLNSNSIKNPIWTNFNVREIFR